MVLRRVTTTELEMRRNCSHGQNGNGVVPNLFSWSHPRKPCCDKPFLLEQFPRRRCWDKRFSASHTKGNGCATTIFRFEPHARKRLCDECSLVNDTNENGVATDLVSRSLEATLTETVLGQNFWSWSYTYGNGAVIRHGLELHL